MPAGSGVCGMAAEPKHFIDLFNKPSVEAMHALSPRDFERFVAYVLRRAGYEVKEVGPHWLRGVDLEMRRPGSARIVGGVECKRFQSDTLVDAGVVAHLLGAASVSGQGAKPYVFTTSDFHPNAHKKAEAGAKKAHLMNGTQLVRYITYIRGSRYHDDDTSTVLSPEFFAGREDLNPGSGGGARILTIANNKGGVGKTTTAFYLGAELANQGKRVLLIDLDSQANLTEYCFPGLNTASSNRTQHFPNLAQYFARQQPLHALVKSTSADRLCIIPSDPYLRLRDPGGSGRPDIETQFAHDVQDLGAQMLASLGGAPDWIILDTPPAMTLLTRAGLAAAHFVLAPMRPRKLSLIGTENMLETLRTVNALTRNRAKFLGTVFTHWDDLKLSQDFATLQLPTTLQEFGGEAFQVTIPLDNQLETLAPNANTRGAKAYRSLAAEVLQHVH
jgi:chromosome partitioning protein